MLFLATYLALPFLGLSPAPAMINPPAPAQKQIICYMGRKGQPSGCVTIVRGGLVVS